MARTKSEWKKTLESLDAKLPDEFDGKAFRSCRVDGSFSKDKVAGVCDEKGFKDKADAVFAYLTHKNSKPGSSGNKRGAKKQATGNEPSTTVDLLAKKTYKSLTASVIEKLITMLTEIQKDRNDKEIADLKTQRAQIDMKLKERGVK